MIRKLSNDDFLQLFLNKEDIEQDLVEKLLKNFDKVSGLKSREEAFSYAKTMFKNELVDMRRKCHRRYHHSKNTLILSGQDGEETDYLIEDSVNLLAGELLPRTESPLDLTLYNQLKKLIVKWLESQDESTKRFIIESISPSDQMLEMYEEKIKTYGKTPHQRHIPPKNRAELLGISEKKMWSIMLKLAKYLTENGFKCDTYEF